MRIDPQYFLHIPISLILFSVGIYVYFEKKLLMVSKFSGGVYNFNPPGHILVSMSFIFVAVFMILILSKKQHIQTICKVIFMVSLALFSIGLTMYAEK